MYARERIYSPNSVRLVLAHFKRIFHANLDAHLKKLLKQKKITNFGQSISSIFFKAKINFKNAPTLGKRSTINYDLAKRIMTQNAKRNSCKSIQK